VKLETVSIDSLKPDPHNARGHEEGVPELAASLVAFGQQKNLVVWQIDPRYVDVIIKRWETISGKKAKKLK
jgi:ParB-like chromosome segregation protein Spo0J